MSVKAIYHESGGSPYIYYGSAGRMAQSFTIPAGYSRIDYIRILCYRVNFTSDTLYIDVHTDSSGSPSGTVIATGSVSSGDIPTTGGWTGTGIVAFSDFSVTAGSTYWMVLRQPTSTSTTDGVLWYLDTDGGYSGGVAKASVNSGSSWSTLGADCDWNFRIYAYGVPTGLGATTVSSIGETTATAASEVTGDGGDAVTSRGFYYSHTTNTPTASNSTVTSGSGTGSFSATLTGLGAGLIYYVRSFAINQAGTTYGATQTFYADTNPPSVTTSAASSVDKFTATLNGNVTSDHGATITERGFVIATTTNPLIGGSGVTKNTVAGTTGAYTYAQTGLSGNTKYYFKAYATNSEGTTYGGELDFTTLPAVPIVTTATETNVADTTITLGGNVTSDGGSTVTERGIAYGVSANPTTSGSKVVVAGTTGAYTGNVTGLTPATLYHARAYAINTYGTSYGADEEFTTLPSNPSGLTATATGKTTINLSWTKGTGADTSILVRKTGSYPANVGDGTQVYTGAGSSYTDTSLTAGTVYYYRVWSLDGASNYSTSYSGATATTDFGLTNPANVYADDTTYATAPANDNKVYVKLSGDGGATWSTEIEATLPASNGVVTIGAGSTELWGRSWTGDDVDDTSFRMMVTLGSNKKSYQIFKDFGFTITSTYILTGIEVKVKGYFDTDTSYIDSVASKIYYGSSVLPITAGTQAYDTTTNTLKYYNGTTWVEIATV